MGHNSGLQVYSPEEFLEELKMMRHRWSWFSLVIAILLVCASGCGKESNHYGNATLVVDGVGYAIQFHADVDRRGRITTSLLRVRCPLVTDGSSWSEITADRGTTFTTWTLNGKDVVAKADTLYFMRGGEIVFEKEYQEIGIHLRQKNADFSEILEYLTPILANMIREHVNTQDPETEE